MLQECLLNRMQVFLLFLFLQGKKNPEMIILYTDFCTRLSLAACGDWNNY